MVSSLRSWALLPASQPGQPAAAVPADPAPVRRAGLADDPRLCVGAANASLVPEVVCRCVRARLLIFQVFARSGGKRLLRPNAPGGSSPAQFHGQVGIAQK